MPVTETIKVGDTAPDFETVDDTNQKVKLSDFRGKKVVLYFYPKDDTPGCTTQACGFRDNAPQLADKNAVVLGVSTDDVASHQAFKSKYDLNFPLLIDPDHAISEQYGVWGERTVNERTFMGVHRSHFVIDESGKVTDVQYNVNPAESPALSIKEL
jgi:thioredoxin-dependent peroxiredoxin